jgi:hypothetical protein
MTAAVALGSVAPERSGSAPGSAGSVAARAAMLDVLARAASPAERIAGGWLRPSGEPAVAELRLARWSQRIADGRPERIAEILTEHGFTPGQWLVGLGDVTAEPGEPLPQWARDALTLLEMVGSEPGPHHVPRLREVTGDGLPDWVDPDQPWRFHPGFRDWLAAAGRAVNSWAGGAPISDAACRELVLDLARRMLTVSGPLLMQAAAGRGPDDPLFAGDARHDWEALWATHPVVARLLATVWRQWQATTVELCGRIAVDLPSVCPGAEVDRIDLSAGDQHCSGRGVARLWMTDGASIFLKPRSDRLRGVLGAVLERVDTAGSPLGLRIPDVIERDGYAWVREIVPGDCPDKAGVDAYFRRAGALLRVVQALGSTDLHHENFIPTADLPVLIDLETVVAPGPLRTAPPGDAIAARLADTPGPTSMVTSVITGPPGRNGADIGALAGPVESMTPYEVRMLTRGAGGPELRGTRAPLVNGAALPRLGGRPVSLRGHEQALIDGYTDAQVRLAALIGTPPAPGPHPEPTVRFVARPTRTYARLLLQSTAPAALVDGVEREFVLELLYRATGTAPSGLIGCEADAMRDLDVPLFTVPFSRPDLVSDRGVTLADVLTESPADRTRARLRAVADRDDHVEDLLATVFAMEPDEQPAAPIRSQRDSPDGAAVDRTEPVALLLDRAIEGRAGTLGWVGLEHDPNRNRWTYGRLSPGLTGQAGIGLALATVAASAADQPAGCGAAARAALLDSVQRIGRGDQGPADAFGGPAGVLYAAAVAARLLDDPGLLDAARSLLAPCLRAARRDQPSVVIDGAAGAILALLALPPDAATDDAHTELLELTRRSTAAVDLDPPDAWSMSLPSRAAGIALARHRLAGVRTPGKLSPELPTAGHPGDEIADATVHPPQQPNRPLPPDAGLRTLLDEIALAQVAVRAGGGAAWTARREQLIDGVLTRRAVTGRWAAPLLAPDAALVSPFHGLAALAVLFAEPAPDVPMVRTLT